MLCQPLSKTCSLPQCPCFSWRNFLPSSTANMLRFRRWNRLFKRRRMLPGFGYHRLHAPRVVSPNSTLAFPLNSNVPAVAHHYTLLSHRLCHCRTGIVAMAPTQR
eukprot:Blabericola_migrator_1__1723@NODE_1463_length_4505_cov_224_617846_g238_i2_p9_GENE_NODE_1463_length_4505_cov_224_617846_g238_i2NODE_1463_length_4505_cov_224_617846_g238_i2_p9_ORF_typecomplete_len105_score1_82preSET_CXC/PF18264_1/0_31preSET_CXC/PF18264_1/1_7e03_NODE_1463_length_4505_cov_224_617846_g238_i211391453